MQKSKFTKSQIVAAIKKQESGVPVKEISRNWVLILQLLQLER